MDAIKQIVIIALILMIIPISTVSGENAVDYDAYKDKWDLLYEDKNDWLCVDYAVNYARNNPGWGMVILSPSPAFRYQPHMVNYRIEGNMLLIHEAQVNHTYEIEIVNGTMTVPFYEEFPNDFSSQWARGTYFHFIPNETKVVRTYFSLNDNRNDFFDYENISRHQTINTSIEADDEADVLLIKNSSINTSANITLNDDITDDGDIKNFDASESYNTKFIRFLKSILEPFFKITSYFR